MADDWIKMRVNLDTNPHVIEMASILGLPELHVVGMLWKVWSWADTHTIDGNAVRVTFVTLDRFTCVTGFAKAMQTVGWLQGEDGSLTFTNFMEHNGETAKKRANTAKRVQKHRNANSVTNVTHKALPEKRREEKSNNSLSQSIAIPKQWDTPEFWEAVQDYRQVWFNMEGQQLPDLELSLKLKQIAGRQWSVEKVIRSIAKAASVRSNRFFDPDEQAPQARGSPPKKQEPHYPELKPKLRLTDVQ